MVLLLIAGIVKSFMIQSSIKGVLPNIVLAGVLYFLYEVIWRKIKLKEDV
jgi:hypothetical protein